MKKSELIKLLIKYLEQPRTIFWLTQKLQVSDRSIYRYLKEVSETHKLPVQRKGISRPAEYYLK